MAGRLLIVDDVATNRIVLKVKLAEARHDVILAATAAECMAQVRAALPDLVILDHALRDRDGIALLRDLRADPATRELPVILTLPAEDTAARLAALRAGADDVMTKPLDDTRLRARIRALLRMRDGLGDARGALATLGALGLAEAAAPFEAPSTVALVTERRGTAQHLRDALAGPREGASALRTLVMSSGEALSQGAQSPDAYLIEAAVGGDGGGLRLLSELRSRGASRHAAICILQPDACGDEAAIAFDLGADDVMPPDVPPEEIALRTGRALRRKHAQDRQRDQVSRGLRLAVLDPLTGLHNRRYAESELARMLMRTRDKAAPLAVMIIDLDRFKTVNDAFGHAAGDCVLTEVARRLTASLRDGDLLARIGGEEFLAALPGMPLAEAGALAVQLCRAIEARPIDIGGGRKVLVTASIGLAGLDGTAFCGPATAATLVAQADGALLRSKNLGRNQVSISQSAA
jgi:two-component system cell cycle response regulator